MNTILTPEQDAKYGSPRTIQRLLNTSRTIAIVGLSKDPQKASHFVATYLQYEGYRIIPVNPTLSGTLLGETVYPDLRSIPQDIKIDMVDVFRGDKHAPEIARQAVEIGAKSVWLQLRIVSEEAAAIAEAGGLDVVMDRCVKMEHGRYAGSLHWVGMNTGILTAKKARK